MTEAKPKYEFDLVVCITISAFVVSASTTTRELRCSRAEAGAKGRRTVGIESRISSILNDLIVVTARARVVLYPRTH